MSDNPFPHPSYSQHVLQPAYADAQSYLFNHMLACHEAHTVMLAEQEIITSINAAVLLDAIESVRNDGVEAYAYQAGIEDLFFRIESRIIDIAGADFGGNLQLARSRNDLGHALARMALREEILDLYADLLQLRRVVAEMAGRHLNTLMPGYTHTQPAQPVTFAHYLAGVLSFLAKDQRRLAGAYVNMNESPLGAAAFTGTGFPIDRARVSELLGFETVIMSTQHSIGCGDNLTDLAFAIQSLAIGLSRITHDLLNRATRESNALHIDNSFIQISSIMPQKRNPVVLEHLRARLSRALGYAQTVTVQCHNIPYGDTQDIEDEILPPLTTALDTLRDCVSLYSAFFETLSLNEAHLRAEASAGFTTATELADTLVRDAGLPFRIAHRIVAGMVHSCYQPDGEVLEPTLDLLQAVARRELGHDLSFSDEQMQRALDPQHFVDVRSLPGGVAATATASLLDNLRGAVEEDSDWLVRSRAHLLAAAETRQAAAASWQSA